ncbi:HlyD family secretion protein [Paracoccus fistulariae]|uniref:HlyD family secretion protein n=1 Tax=Paracoccus fistulariae TaxID=658446 RepID=A0ABY7SQ18_9RHOB|nr:HlyD family secretion protein [Paracoccus fistulariae]MDB6183159.1 HlyD family secretion protein [Paracoccus fistulariae]WCR09150.1 HlyD family secretion protein [Paracoccus fistulariae]
MLEALLCSLITILPDYLYRRYGQGKRFGKEITIYSVWFELRYGIMACLILTLSLITMIFYYHPSTSNVTSAYRTVSILPEIRGRVAEVYVQPFQKVKAGDPLFRLDSSAQEAAVDTANKRVAEVEASITVAESELVSADAKIAQVQAALKQAQEDLDTQLALQRQNSSVVAQREIDRLENVVAGNQAELNAANAAKQTLTTQIQTLLPAQKASAEAQVRQAQDTLDDTLVTAQIDGTLQQFTLRVGEVVNPVLRTAAGVLIPEDAGRERMVAGFGQIETNVLKVGMVGEVSCIARPFKIIPMVVVEVQDVIASGQVRASDQLVDVQQLATPGTVTAVLEPLFPDQYGKILPGSSCVANVYTSTHEQLENEDVGFFKGLFLHAVEATGLVHAMILRMQTVVAPVRTLVLSGGH